MHMFLSIFSSHFETPTAMTQPGRKLFSRLPLLIIAMLTVVLLGGCSSNDDKGEKPETSEDLIYKAAQRNLNAHQWKIAIDNLQLLEENFPFGQYAEQAQLELIYAYHESYDPEAALAAADRFIRLHPQHRNVDYAYYMKGLSTFPEGNSILNRFVPTDITNKDTSNAKESFGHFAQLLARFPGSPYAADAEKRMIYLRNLLARYEIHVANYYFKRGAYLAATNRGRYVVENFQKTPAVPDALAVMIQGYHLMDMPELAENSLKVLRSNYPNYPALKSNGEFNYSFNIGDEAPSWINRLTFGLFDKAEPPGFDSRKLYNSLYREENVQSEDVDLNPNKRSWLSILTFGLL